MQHNEHIKALKILLKAFHFILLQNEILFIHI